MASPAVDVSVPYDASSLRNKTMVVTGAANGLGAAMARQWASHGAHIIIGDLDSTSGEKLVADLRAAHTSSSFAFVPCDVTSWTDQTRLFDEAVRVSPSSAVDVVVPNAGIIQLAEAANFERPVLVDGALPPPSTRTVDVNVTAVLYTVHLALYHFSLGPARDKCLLLMGSLASVYPLAGQAHYTASKHAVCGLFRSLRMTAFTQVPGVVRVNLLAPYFVEQSRMLPTATDIVFLAGTAGGATVPDVVDAATRLVADERLAGRALCVGPRLKASVPGQAPVAQHEGDGAGRAVWELYAHDLDQLDSFTYRYIALMNAVTRLRGLAGLLADIWYKVFRR